MTQTATLFQDLVREVEIPDNGTLSKTLYRDEQLRMIVFAFDRGQELTDHAVPRAAIVQVLSGAMRLTLGEEVVDAGPGAWAHMPPGLPHAVHAREPSVMLLTMLPVD